MPSHLLISKSGRNAQHGNHTPYDRKSHVGTLDKALDQANANDWIIVDMKKDWKTVFPAR